jgi:hypothetical protein
MAAKLARAVIEHHQFVSGYSHRMELCTRREGIFASPKYNQADVARQHEAFYAPDYDHNTAAHHIGVAQTTIDRLEQISFDVAAPILLGSRIALRYFMKTVTAYFLNAQSCRRGDAEKIACSENGTTPSASH